MSRDVTVDKAIQNSHRLTARTDTETNHLCLPLTTIDANDIRRWNDRPVHRDNLNLLRGAVRVSIPAHAALLDLHLRCIIL